MFEKFACRAVKVATRAVKEETVKSVVDIIPTLVGFATIAGVIFGIIPPKKVAPSTITINNFYYVRG